MVQPHDRADYATYSACVGVPWFSDPSGGWPLLFHTAVHACIHVPGGTREQGMSAHSAKRDLAG